MGNNQYKKYKENAIAGIKGEAFFQTIISTYAIPHQILREKDLGLDYICEWVVGEKPTGVLFGVQLKTVRKDTKSFTIKESGIDDNSKLPRYNTSHSNLNIDEKTKNYWKGFGIPIFLFAIIEKENTFDCFYRRYTASLTKKEVENDKNYFKVNDGTRFIAFADEEKKTGGFARDLYFDFLRCQYSKGIIHPLKASDFGLGGFPDNAVFVDLFRDYQEQIEKTFNFSREVLGQLKGTK